MADVVVSRELLVHVFKGVIRNAQRSQHLLTGGFAFALFLSLMQNCRATQHSSQRQSCSQTLPQNDVALRCRGFLTARHNFSFQAKRRGLPFEGLPQLPL
jgi:hypothetical protein